MNRAKGTSRAWRPYISNAGRRRGGTVNQQTSADCEFDNDLAHAIERLRACPGWQEADSLACVNARLRLWVIAKLNLGSDQDREMAVVRVLDARAEPYLELVE